MLVIDYLALDGTANGGTEVTSYQIMWNQGESIDVYVELQDSLSNQVIVSDSVVGGVIYGFKYRATNRQGSGDYSDIAYFKAANVPDQMVPVLTTQVGTDMRVDWIAPNSGSL